MDVKKLTVTKKRRQ